MQNEIFLLESPEFWKSIAFLLALSAILIPIYRFCLKYVKQRNKVIISQMEEALSLLQQAKESLNVATEKCNHVQEDKKLCLKNAEKSVEDLKKEAYSNFDSVMLKREKENEQRISLIREDGIKQLRDKVIDFTVDVTQTVLKDSSQNQEILVDKSLEEIQQVLQNEKNVELLKNMLLEEG